MAKNTNLLLLAGLIGGAVLLFKRKPEPPPSETTKDSTTTPPPGPSRLPYDRGPTNTPPLYTPPPGLYPAPELRGVCTKTTPLSQTEVTALSGAFQRYAESLPEQPGDVPLLDVPDFAFRHSAELLKRTCPKAPIPQNEPMAKSIKAAQPMGWGAVWDSFYRWFSDRYNQIIS